MLIQGFSRGRIPLEYLITYYEKLTQDVTLNYYFHLKKLFLPPTFSESMPTLS
jgi:hypothetical protein